ncbi:MAG TPA: hypothetical protein VL485_07185 [Ktedonobacteraceae bacterium]|jgi:hypothetical protein|nr:hypothetical protein [Ktedonobacteraceae bacterium]
MVRQCAWCLRLIDADGGRISPAPLPKLYDATHGMCEICGALWIEQVLGCQSTQMVLPCVTPSASEAVEQTTESDESIQVLGDLPLPWS